MSSIETKKKFDPRISFHPPCPECGHSMFLSTIEPLRDALELRRYQCEACGHIEEAEMKFYE
jgi:ribosomal protein S27AE